MSKESLTNSFEYIHNFFFFSDRNIGRATFYYRYLTITHSVIYNDIIETDPLMVSNYRRPWTPDNTTADESPVCC